MCRCPKCDLEFNLTNVIDYDSSGNILINQGYGYYSKYKTKYWIDILYEFNRHYEIEEMKDE